jgi:hypothetical protein
MLNPTAENIDKEEVSWSLSWQREGHCDRFTRESILASAPPASGVYGLFNNDCQVFIGESANIQEALLRHESETDFQSRHLQPTGFTFEPCAAELRKPKADELIARFCPVLQTDAALTETWSLSDGPIVNEAPRDGEALETDADDQEFPVHERDESPNVRQRFDFKRTRGVALAAFFVAGAAAIFYLGIPAGEDVQKGMNGQVPPAAKSDSRENASGVQALSKLSKSRPMAHSAESANLSKKWSVQISATPAKDVANSLVQRLKDKGYDGYVVQANVNGQTYYRVRVGHFDARQEAESVRQSLSRQEGYGDAYLAGD